MNKNTNPAKWLELATSKASNRPEYQVLYGNVGTDGYRIHRDNSLPAAENDDFITRVATIIPTQPRNRATVSRQDLIIACKRAFAFRDEFDRKNKNYPVITFCLNGSLQYSAKNEGVGSTHGEIIDGQTIVDKTTPIKNGIKYHSHKTVFKHHNPEKVVSFGLNVKYLLDALEGLQGNTVEIDIPSPRAPFYITDGTREAVIMPVNIA